MSLKIVLIVAAVLGLVFGIGFALIPTQMHAGFGLTTDATGRQMARDFGVALLALAVMGWFARDSGDSIARRAITLGLCVYFGLAAISELLWALSGVPNAVVWVIFAMMVIMAVAFGYFVVTQRGKVKA